MAQVQALVIESNSPRAQTLGLILQNIAGYDTKVATTVIDAVRYIKEQEFDLLLLNTTIHRPLDGIKFVQLVLLRQLIPKQCQVMIISHEKQQAVVKKCLRAGVVDYIIYPYDPPNLLERIQKALGEHQELDKTQLRQQVREVLREVIDLPTLSQVHDQVEELTKSADTSAGKVAGVIELDQSMTAKVLRLSNSASYGFVREITSVKDAVSLLGFETVRASVATIATFEALGRVEESPNFNREAFWQHSIGCGAIAKVIAGKLGMDAAQAFAAGILHDIGKVALDSYFPDFFAQVLQMAAKEKISLFEAEKACLPVTHEEVGRYLGERWALPERLIEVIGAHNSMQVKQSKFLRLVLVVYVADAQCQLFKIGNAGDGMYQAPQPIPLKRLGITQNNLTEWTGEMMEEVEKSASTLNLL
jgi:putative nucleotidyltransferase with HDIG domain